jgi:hypothetical protein
MHLHLSNAILILYSKGWCRINTCGWTIDPPAANEYAVLPDVVDKINPSPCTQVTKELSQ